MSPRARIAGALAALAIAPLASGCTVIGAAAGAGIDHYEATAWPQARVEPGTPVRVRTRAVGSDSLRAADVDGRYGGVHDGMLVLTDTDRGEQQIPLADVVEVEVRRGSEWKKGLLLGAIVDTCLVVAVIGATQSQNASISAVSFP